MNQVLRFNNNHQKKVNKINLSFIILFFLKKKMKNQFKLL